MDRLKRIRPALNAALLNVQSTLLVPKWQLPSRDPFSLAGAKLVDNLLYPALLAMSM